MILTVTLNPAIDKVYEVDSFSVGDVFRPNQMWATAGGKGLNVSRVASILGEEVVATCFLGGGNGQFIRKELERLGIKDAFMEIEGDTRICIAINDPIANTSTELLEPGPIISPQEQIEFLNGFRIIAKDVDIVTISGSLPSGVPINFYGELITICKELNKRVILDTSGKTLATNLKFMPYMIKPNNSELEAITGMRMVEEKDILKAAQRIHKEGIELVCITLGKDGSIVVTKEGAFRLKAPSLETVSTVGSGDSFIAGCAVALIKGESLENVFKMGMACGMSNTQFAKTGYVLREQVEKFFDMVTVTKMYE